MLTRRAFVGGAVGLAAGAARAAPIPAEVARQPGIILETRAGDVLFLNERGQEIRRIPVRRIMGPRWRLVSVSRDGTRAALLPTSTGESTTSGLVVLPLSEGTLPIAPIYTPRVYRAIWSGDGQAVIGVGTVSEPHGIFSRNLGRNIHIDLTTRRWSEIPVPHDVWSERYGPSTRHWVTDWSADGRLLLTEEGTRHEFPRGLHIVRRSDGVVATTIPDLGETSHPSPLAPDGSRVLIFRRDGPVRDLRRGSGLCTARVVSYPLGQDEQVELGRWQLPFEHVADSFGFAWRADSRRVAILVQRWYTFPDNIGYAPRASGELLTCDRDGGDRRVVRSWTGWMPFRLLGWA